MKYSVFFALLLASCSAPPAPVRTTPQASSARSSASASSAAPTYSGDAGLPALQAEKADAQTEASSADTDQPLVAFETPYKLGQRPKLSNADIAQREEQALTTWNQGGREGNWHPQPRVMVDNVKVKGRLSDAVVLRETRKQHYWPIRKCYDAALLRDQALHGKVHVQFTIRHTGAVKGAKRLGKSTLNDTTAVDCLVHSLSTLKFPPTARGDATVTLDIGLNPGDLPVRATEETPPDPGPGQLDMPAVQAIVAGRAGHDIQDCYEQALARIPSLWGRLAVRIDIDAKGTVLGLTETESTFPDPIATTCVIDALRKVVFPAPRNGDLKIVVPFRCGKPAN